MALFTPGSLLDPLNPVQPKEEERQPAGGLFTPSTLASTVPAPQPRDPADDLHIAVRNARSTPSVAARALNISANTGLEPSVALRNQQSLEPEQERQRLKDLAFGRPALTQFFTDPMNVDLGRDEADRLAHIEDIFRGNRPSQFQEMAAVLSGADNAQLFRLRADALTRGMDPQKAEMEAVLRMGAYRNRDMAEPAPDGRGFIERTWDAVKDSNVGRAFRSGDMMVDRGQLYSQKMMNVLTGVDDLELDKQIAAFEQQEAAAPKYEEGWFASAAQLLPYMGRSIIHGQKRGGEFALGFGAGALALGQAGPQVALPEEVITVPAAMATGYAAGTAVGSTEFVARTEAGNAFGDIRKITDETGKPIDDRVAAVAALGVGAVNAALERLGLSAVAKTIPGGQQLVGRFTTEATKQALKSPSVRQALLGVAKKYGEALFTETTTEMLQEVSGILGEEAAKIASGDSFKGSFGNVATPENLQRIVDTGVAAFQGTAVLGAPGSIASAATRTKKAAQLSQVAQENKDFFTAVNQAVEGSKLRDMVPERFKAYAQQLEDLPGAPKEVFVPAEALAQAVGDEAQLKTFLESAGIADQYAAALAEKGDVRIPMSEFLTRVAGTEAAVKLENDFRFNERQMTPREAAEWAKNYMDLWGEDVKRAQAVAEQVATENEGAAQVHDTLKNGLSAIGLKADEADAQSAIWAARATVAAEGYTRAGQTMTPLEWLRSKNLTIRNEKNGTSFSVNSALGQPGEQGQTLNQDHPATAGVTDPAQVAEAQRLWAEKGVESPYFKNWFGGSKVVDAEGKPLVVYHGTTSNVEAFDPTKSGVKSKTGAPEGTFFFTDKSDVAGSYTVEFQGDFSQKLHKNASVMPTYLSLKKPLKVNAKGEAWSDIFYKGEYRTINEIAELAKASGKYDGVIVTKVRDKGVGSVESKTATTYIAFDPTQIKSVFNRGTFDASDPRILMQSAFHGSPYRFDKFSLEHIGSGEGAQAFGYGLYFAGSKQVAEYYRSALENPTYHITVDGKRVSPLNFSNEDATPKMMALKFLAQPELYGDAVARAEWFIENAKGGKKAFWRKVRSSIKKFSGKDIAVEADNKGQLYEVEIPDDRHLMLWDKPLSEQPEAVKKALAPVIDLWVMRTDPEDFEGARERLMGSMTGMYLYRFEDLWKAVDEAGGFAFDGDRSVSEYLRSLGIPGHKYLDGTSRSAGEGSYNYVIYDDQAVQIAKTYYQQLMAQATRPSGAKASVDLGQSQIVVNLFRTADQSSFAHESGHIFLEDLRDLALLPNAPQQVKDDWAAVKRFTGATSDELSVDNHETFARAFEAYLREGKAPAQELHSVFQRFKGWLTRIYRSVLSLNVEVNDEIRGVMDRLLATDEMIQQAEQAEGIAPQFATAEEAGMDQAEFAAYRKAFDDARERAKEMLLAKAMKEIKDRDKAWYTNERERAWEAERDAILAEPAYKALYTISKGEFPGAAEGEKINLRLDSGAIRSEFGEEALKGLAKTVPPLASKTGLHPDVVAGHLGFSSGHELVQALQNLRPMNDVIAERVDARMKEYDKIMADRDLHAEAEATVNNDMRLEFLALEEELVNKRQNAEQARKNFAAMAREAAARSAMIRRAADEAIGNMKVTVATQIGRHVQAERKAANEAIAAAKKGDNAALAEAKRRQMIAAALASRARDAKEEVDSALNYLKKFDSPGVRKNLARDYLDQIDQMLERFDLRKSVTGPEIERRKSLTRWIEEQKAKGFEPNISEKMEAEARRISYKDMPLSEFRDLRDAVKSIEHIARLKQKLLTARNQRTFEGAVHEMTDATYKAFGDKMGPERLPREAAKKKPLLKQIDADLTKVEFMCLVLDGGKMNGPWWEMIYRPINDGFNRKAQRFLEIKNALYGKDMFGAYSEKEMVRMRSKKFFVAEVNESFTKEQLIAIALNRGNQYNWSAVLQGEAWSPEQGEAVLKLLDDRDWAVVQKIWNYLDTFRPEIGALYKRLSGVEPTWVQGDAFTTSTGKELTGGYYPLKADRDLEIRASQREEAKTVQEMFGGNGFRPSTRNGHIIERKGFGGQRVSFSLDVLVRHLDEVTHDLYLREAVIDVDRMLQDERIQHTVVRALGREQYDQLRPWLAATAGQKAYDYDGIQRIFKTVRKNATMAIMGLKSTVFFSQYGGGLNAVPLIATNTSLGYFPALGVVYTNLSKVILGGASASKIGKFAEEHSIELKDIRHNFERDVRDMASNFGFGKKVSQWEEALMYFTGLADYHIRVACWKTAFDAKLKDGATEQQAFDFADSVARMSQGTGKDKDLSSMQRGNEYKRMFTMFYSYMNVNYNQVASAGKLFHIGKRKGAFMGALIFYWAGPAILTELLAGRGPDDDKDETWLGWAAKNMAMYPTGFFPGIRDVVRSFEDDYGRPTSLLDRMGSSFRNLAKEYGDDDGDNAALFWKALEAAGYFVPFPTGQAKVTIKQFWEYMNNERDDLSLLFYKKK